MSEVFVPPAPLQTAVLFLVFNRPETTRQVFEAIRQAKPPRLYVAADGPRANREGEAERAEQVRKIATAVDWPCEVKTLFREINLGCKMAVSRGIDWFFENEEQGIILEDDCLPSQSFFWYCEELLNKYKLDQKIYLISGDARGPESFGMHEDYGFCKYPLIWGWASWARIWRQYDVKMLDWPSRKLELVKTISPFEATNSYWADQFDKTYFNKIDTWDYQLSFLLLKNSGRCIVPHCNLITNIGFGGDATHTTVFDSRSANRKRFEISLPLMDSYDEDSFMKINKFYDKNIFSKNNMVFRIFNKLRRIFGMGHSL
jgi:hypothetical protein